jgi:hypothetical protein
VSHTISSPTRAPTGRALRCSSSPWASSTRLATAPVIASARCPRPRQRAHSRPRCEQRAGMPAERTPGSSGPAPSPRAAPARRPSSERAPGRAPGHRRVLGELRAIIHGSGSSPAAVMPAGQRQGHASALRARQRAPARCLRPRRPAPRARPRDTGSSEPSATIRDCRVSRAWQELEEL